MAVTVTSYRVVPFPLLMFQLWAIERFVTIDDVEQTKSHVAIFIHESDANAALTLPQYSSTRWED